MTDNRVCCPNCHHHLSSSTSQNGFSHCFRCDARYTVRNGVIDFIPQNDFYWGEIDLVKMRQINDDAEQLGNWYSSICEHLAYRPSLIKYVTDPARLGWLFHCYDENHNQACLDVGSGWGLLSFGLSRFYQTVYSVDGVYERIRFQSIRAKIDGIQNIHFLRSTLLKLPLHDQSVDLVVLNGVLEWIGLSDLHQKPADLQKIFLKEIRRVLKPDGRIYLGIENRFSFLYFLGEKDHSGLPYTSLVPRTIASRMVRMAHLEKNVKGSGSQVFSGAETEYRTYTYSLWGYKKLLKDAGFTNFSTYWAWQSYSYPRVSGPIDGKSIRYYGMNISNLVDNKWKRLSIRFALLLPTRILGLIARIFWPHFLIYASCQTSNRASLQEALLKNQKAHSFIRQTLGTNSKIKTTFLLLDKKLNVSKSIRVTQQTKSIGRNTTLLCQEEPGKTGRLIRPYHKRDIQEAVKWLLEFQKETLENYWTDEDLICEMNDLVKTARSIPYCDHDDNLLKEFESKYIREIRLFKIGIVDEHGDFTPPNIIVSDNRNFNVIDWEHSREKGNPLMDVGSFYLSLLRRSSPKTKFQTQYKSGSPLLWFVVGIKKELQIPFTLSPTYYLLRVVKRIADQQNQVIYVNNSLSEWAELLNLSLNYSLAISDTIFDHP